MYKSGYVVPTWDGDGLRAQDWVLSYARWERDVGVALGEAKLIKTLLGVIPKDVADLIDERAICRNLSYAQVKESVLREVNRRVNRNVPDHFYLKYVNTSASPYGFSYAHSCYVQGVCVAAHG